MGVTYSYTSPGVVGTLVAGVLGQWLAGRQSLNAWLREQRLALYSDALRREVHLRATRLADAYDVKPPGGHVEVVPQDEVSIRMDLLAHRDVREAWREVVKAELDFEMWVEHEYSGAPDEEAPSSVTQPLEDSLGRLRETCRRCLSTHRWRWRRSDGMHE
ncbi:hypothetical protein [Cellulomonas phragmiteti]|uniref:SMODS and SLOG-associating 2TM effector domain-containing protein n=1 Tax=Cellulomonas phragmiteti TaxID=478780 RepID=A0ABQ4DFW4_9CELL|nr:hypothetical protein [Cellulomonas phragmiteti]GIG38240.1 hypothetical protein Cph01nite_00020 [Cellulomonas phragmiteti]